MQDQARGLSIVFNGEIYNFVDLRNELSAAGYSFRSNTDTEVILAAYDFWGDKCLTRLNGMFAIAIFDARKRIVFLARDRAGEKPLFYRLERGTLYFSSELKGLLANPNLPRDVDPEALDSYLATGIVAGDRCILKGYNKLPAAHAMRFDLQAGDAKLWRYWQLPEFDNNSRSGDEESLLYELETLLEDSVARQMTADVPVGILLSGGVDSSLITAMAARRSSKLRTFCVGFPGHAKLDETAHARLIARHFGTEHTELVAEPTTADLLPVLARQFDEPMADSSMFPTYLLCNQVRTYCSVALGGDGGDELFAGYNRYSNLLWIQRKLASIPIGMRRGISNLAGRFLPAGLKGKNYLQALGVDLQTNLPLLVTLFEPAHRRKLLRYSLDHPLNAEEDLLNRTPLEEDLLQRATRMDFQNYLADDILVKVDRCSMLASLEVRAPLLDYRLIEFAYRVVPSHLKAMNREKKILLKRLANLVLPSEFDKKRKQGFSIPMTDWLKAGPFRELFWDTLFASDCLFDTKVVTHLFKGQDAGLNNSERLFALVQFEIWRKTHKVAL